MPRPNLRRLALMYRVVQTIRLHAHQRFMREAAAYWRRLIRPN